MHKRQLIRDWVVATLFNATAAGAAVFSSRAYRMEGNVSPSISVYTRDELSQPSTIGAPGDSVRELIIDIEVYIKSKPPVDTQLDDIAVEIEGLLGGSCKPITEILAITYVGFKSEYSGAGENPAVVGLFQYEILYGAINGDPT